MSIGAIRTLMIVVMICVVAFIGIACWIGFWYTLTIWLVCFLITLRSFRKAEQTAMPDREDLPDTWHPPEVIDTHKLVGSWLEPNKAKMKQG